MERFDVYNSNKDYRHGSNTRNTSLKSKYMSDRQEEAMTI